MSIWKQKATPAELNAFANNTLISHLGIEVDEIGEDFISATMPVSDHTKQPMGYLHGGASVVLAETLGSVAAHLCSDKDTVSFGVEINANHLKSIREGLVRGVAKPLRLGKTIQVWDIQISSEQGDLICASRITVTVRPLR